MRVVVDTNVLVSALIRPGGPPRQVLDDVLSGELTLLYDERILTEYGDVLTRAKFSFDSADVEDLLRFVAIRGKQVPDASCPARLPDPDDQPFADVAHAGAADLLITGNAKHFPVGKAILSFRQLGG